MSFKNFKLAVQKFAEALCKNTILYVTDTNGDELYAQYIAECTKHGENKVFKNRGQSECTCCHQFIRNYGSIVVTKDNNLVSIWDAPNIPAPFDMIAKVLSVKVKSAAIKDMFFSESPKLGTDISLATVDDTVTTFNHFFLNITGHACVLPNRRVSVDTKKGEARSTKEVFQRSLNELSLTATEIVLELIASKSLYRGEDHKFVLESFLAIQKEFEKIQDDKKDFYYWEKSLTIPASVARIKNTSVGTLLADISAGTELDTAVGKFEKLMAPSTYKRPAAVFTKKMVEEAENTINELGYGNSLSRRFAVANDITVNDVLFVDRSIKPKMLGSLLSGLKEDAKDNVVNVKKLDKVEEMPIEQFMKDILPTCASIDILMENRHKQNLVSLIAPQDPTAKSMFSWGNNFSWTYNGNITDSMKELVKAAGGKTDGPLRFSIKWNEDGKTESDYDAHCEEPAGHMYYAQRYRPLSSTCILDVDIVSPSGKTAVENITWSDSKCMRDGLYKFYVHCFSKRNGVGGFAAELEFDGEVHEFSHPTLRNNEKVLVAEVLRKNGLLSVTKSISGSANILSTPIWGIKTNTFSKVSIVTLSPNFWHGKSHGNKHYMFIVDGCMNSETPRGFFNEFLTSELTPHRRVFEALGSKMIVPASNDQLSGLGFSSTQRNSVVLKVTGKYQRVIKVNF